MGKTCENHEKQWKETLKTSRFFPTKNGMVHGFALREQSKL